MERKLASIQRIAEIKPIENADAIEAVRVNGWWVVAKKGEFQVGSWCVYFEIDSWIPEHIAPFLIKNPEKVREFNGVRGERLRTIKLRGQISQGLVLPVTQFTEFPMEAEDEGRDVTEILGIQKWEAPINPQLAGIARGNFPSFIPKTDQERVQNLSRDIREAFQNQETFEVTVKLDGSSITVYFKDGDIGICSRNINLKISDDNKGSTFIKTAFETGLVDALTEYGKNIAIQGELMGPGIQGNRENFGEHQIYVYAIWDIDNQRYLFPSERGYVFDTLVDRGFTGHHVPMFHLKMTLSSASIDNILQLAEGPSLYNPVREGLVFKSHERDFSFKAISNTFLLNEK